MIVNNEGEIPSKIYKYVDFKIAEIIVMDSTLKFSHPSEFNDPLDCHISNIYFDMSGIVDEAIRKDIEILTRDHPTLTIDHIQRGYEYSQRLKIEKAAVCCFSLGFENSSLWAYYANDHKGVCLEFDYTLKKESQFKTIKNPTHGHVQYHFTERFNYCESKFFGMARLFMSKSADWKHEQEFRILTLQGAGIYEFNPLFLSRVIFGLRTSEPDRLKFIGHCRAMGLDHIQYAYAEMNENQTAFRALG